jgi:hypothetical protein
MVRLYFGSPFEVSNRASNLENPGVPSSAEPKPIRCCAQKTGSGLIEVAVPLYRLSAHLGIAMRIRFIKTSFLTVTGVDDAASNRSRGLSPALSTHLLKIHRRNLHVQIDPIHQGPADLS